MVTEMITLPGVGAEVNGDGHVDIDFNSNFVRQLSLIYPKSSQDAETEILLETLDSSPFTKLNIVIQVVGSRGDVQPFIALGNELQRYGHRVRLATHDVFEHFVTSSGLEFYGIGGDPAELMAYMVKNPGLIPSVQSIGAGEIAKKQRMVAEMLEGLWDSCLKPDAGTGNPFVADAIIANPPSFAHIHCAEALGIPVHLMFTMPWSNTRAFPHPLANIKSAGSDPKAANYISYYVVELMTWQGLGHVINEWRRSIDLEEINMFDGPMLAWTLKIPFTYCWSPALVPKPEDWPSYINVCGFFFRDLPSFNPSAELSSFLAAGPPPIYIGFGSIVLDDTETFLNTILEAVRAAGVRAVISKGWSEFAGSNTNDIYWIGDCPHEWLFKNVAAVVHHGGAGTTACGLKNGRPTAVVPFFGDQAFWGNMIARSGAGPEPIPHKMLTSSNLAGAIKYCLSDRARDAAAAMALKINSEKGVQAAARSFHRQLPQVHMPCDLLPNHPAVWTCNKPKRGLRLSKLAAAILVSHSAIEPNSLHIYKSNPIHIETTRWDPVTGGASAMVATAVDLTDSITGMVTKPIAEYRKDRDTRFETHQNSTRGNSNQNSEHEQQSLDGETLRTPSKEVTPQRSRDHQSLARRMASGSLKSISGFAPTALKGMMVDIPLAMTEGMKSIPSHYGSEVRNNGQVTDIGSGVAVAGKTFFWGMVDGLTDVVVEPYKGARKDGMVGMTKGIGKGAVNLVAKNGAGMFGLFAYTSAGIAKSIKTVMHHKARTTIVNARLEEGEWLMNESKGNKVDYERAVLEFRQLKK